MATLRRDTDILHTPSRDLTVSQLQCKHLAREITRLVLMKGAKMIEDRNAQFMKKDDEGRAEAAQPKNWDEKVRAATLHLYAMEGGAEALTFVVNRWAQTDNRKDVQIIWTHAVLDEHTKMLCPFSVKVNGIDHEIPKAPYGKFLRSTPKSAAYNVLVFIAGRNHPAREAKFAIAAAAFKAQGWLDDAKIEAARVQGEAELKDFLGGRKERKGIRT